MPLIRASQRVVADQGQVTRSRSTIATLNLKRIYSATKLIFNHPSHAMSVRRSPPNSPAAPITTPTQVRSDSDISLAISSGSFDNVNTAPRTKPLRPKSPPNKLTSDFEEFKIEIRNLLKEQQEYLTKTATEQSTQLKLLISEIAELKSQNNSLQKSFTEIDKAVSFINKQYEDISKQIELLEKEKRSYRDSIQYLETKLQDLQQLSRSSTIEIRNVPNTEKESTADLTTIIGKLGTTINMPVDKTLVRDIYRLPGKPGTVRPIVVEFTNVETKNQMISSVRKFNKDHPNEDRLSTVSIGLTGDRRPIYVAECLPASTRKLFFMAREFSKRMEYKFCWTANGNIFIRKEEGAKHHLIKSEQSLTDLQALPSE